MKPNELRIGNWVLADKERLVGYIDKRECGLILDNCLSAYSRHLFAWKGIKPIPLTEEWLERFGFTSEDYPGEFWDMKLSDNGDQLSYCHEDKRAYLFNGWDGINVPCEYVHQLQNLYFALTGEELILKDE